MKKTYLFLTLCTLVLLTGCWSKSSFFTTFDGFSTKIYTNKKQYIPLFENTNIAGMKILTEMKEKTGTGDTWFINSFIVAKTVLWSWIDLKEVVDANIKKNQIKLLNYTAIDTVSQKVKCGKLQYSWYITTFSYQLDNEKYYGGQYFLLDNEILYLLSLSSDEEDDISAFGDSIANITCIK